MIKSKMLRIGSLAVSAILLAGCFSTAFADTSSKKIDKEETVYVVTDNQLNVKETIVSDWLKNNSKSEKITDKSELTDIKNVKGDEKFTQDGDKIVWEAGKNDIYYQGKTDKELPVEITASYFLDGKEMKPEEIKGKSGKVEIHLAYDAVETAAVGGEAVDVPFGAVTGLMLDGKDFSNVTVSSGQVVNTGDKYVVVGVAFPGVPSMADLDLDIDGIAKEIIIKADTKDFHYDTMITALSNNLLEDVDSDVASLDDVEKQINKLEDAAAELNNGAETLYKSLKKANSKFDDIDAGAREMKKYMKTLNDKVKELDKTMVSIQSGSGDLVSYIAALQTGLQQIQDGLDDGCDEMTTQLDENIQKLSDTLATLDAGLSTVVNGSGSTPSMAAMLAGVEEYVDGMNQFFMGVQQQQGVQNPQNSPNYEKVKQALAGLNYEAGTLGLSYTDQKGNTQTGVLGGIRALRAGVDGTSAKNYQDGLKYGAKAGVKQLKDGIDTNLGNAVTKTGDIKTGAATLQGYLKEFRNKGTKKLKTSVNQLYTEGAVPLAAGTQQFKSQALNPLEDGAGELANGTSKFKREGIDKIYNIYNDKVKGTVDKFNNSIDASKEYDNFAGKGKNMNGTVKFVIRSEGI